MTTELIETNTESETRVVLDDQFEMKREHLRHIVRPADNLHIWKPGNGQKGQDIVDIARARGIEVRALCGAQFVPTRNPEDVKETCNACLDVASIIRAEDP